MGMGVFKKQGVYRIDYYVNDHRKRERIGLDKKLAATVLHICKVEIAEGQDLEKQSNCLDCQGGLVCYALGPSCTCQGL
jgi:hypothetical protein